VKNTFIDKIGKFKKFLTKHLSFVLTMSITYLLGILFIIFQCNTADTTVEVCVGNITTTIPIEINALEVLINSLVPTTVTYVLGCVMVNIVEVLEGKSTEYLYSIITCFFTFVYAMVFCIYLVMGISLGWIIVELFVTILLLILNVLGYKEKFVNRNHGLT
jgi:hypothetical protein